MLSEGNAVYRQYLHGLNGCFRALHFCRQQANKSSISLLSTPAISRRFLCTATFRYSRRRRALFQLTLRKFRKCQYAWRISLIMRSSSTWPICSRSNNASCMSVQNGKIVSWNLCLNGNIFKQGKRHGQRPDNQSH